MLSSLEQNLVKFCAQFTRLFPLWVLLAAFTAFYQPSLYTWFGNAHITWGLMFVMVRLGWVTMAGCREPRSACRALLLHLGHAS